MSIDIQTMFILILIAFIIGLIIGVTLGKPNYMGR
jgi:hypothetical protein